MMPSSLKDWGMSVTLMPHTSEASIYSILLRNNFHCQFCLWLHLSTLCLHAQAHSVGCPTCVLSCVASALALLSGCAAAAALKATGFKVSS